MIPHFDHIKNTKQMVPIKYLPTVGMLNSYQTAGTQLGQTKYLGKQPNKMPKHNVGSMERRTWGHNTHTHTGLRVGCVYGLCFPAASREQHERDSKSDMFQLITNQLPLHQLNLKYLKKYSYQ